MPRSVIIGWIVGFALLAPVFVIGLSLNWSDGALGAAEVVICAIVALIVAMVHGSEIDAGASRH